MALTRHPRASRALHAWLLAALLLVAQGLGLAHHVAHAPGLAHAGVAATGHGHDHGHDRVQGHAQASAFGAAGHDVDTPECRLIDQLAHADGLCDATWVAPPPPQASGVVATAPAVALRAGSASAYLARAPPLA